MISFKTFLDEKVKKPTGDLKKACWSGYTAVGTKEKNGRTVPNCVPEEVEPIDELTKSDYISAVRKTKDPNFSDDEHGPGYKHGREKIIKRAEKYHGKKFGDQLKKDNKWREFGLHKGATKDRTWGNDGKSHTITKDTYKEEVELEELFDILEEVVDGIAKENNIDPDILWENLEDVSDEELYETAAWRRKEGKSATGGLNAKGIASYRRENPGSKLKKAVTGKVKPGSKAAKRRKSFCARMGGMKGPMKKPNGKPTRKALALRKWKCR